MLIERWTGMAELAQAAKFLVRRVLSTQTMKLVHMEILTAAMGSSHESCRPVMDVVE